MENQEKVRMTFLFVGDVMLGRLVNAVPIERKAIIATMQKLCTQLNTATTWDEQEERLEVRMKQHASGHCE